MDVQAVLEVVRAWPVEDQVRLVTLIQDDLQAQGMDAELSADFKQELDRRIAEHQAHPQSAIPWERVLAEARARHNK